MSNQVPPSIYSRVNCMWHSRSYVILDGQLTPTNYHPLRFTFIIWVMVILGGAGNNLGSILEASLFGFFGLKWNI